MKGKSAVALLSLFLSMPAFAADVPELLRKAQQELEARSSAGALAYLAEAETAAQTPADKARTQFYMARAYELADRVDDAKAAYRKALDADPQYGAALNNLAQVEAADGNFETATALLDRAVALNDDRQLLYKYNLAGIVAQTDDRARAATLYEEILKTRGDDIDVQTRLIRVSEPNRAVGGLRQMLKNGATRDAATLALSLAADPRFKDVGRSLLAVAVEALARQRIPLDAFDASPAGAQLAQLRADPELKEGVRQVRLVYDRAPLGAAAFSWWSQTGECVEAMARLLRESAAQSARAGDTTSAETAYRAALDLQNGQDPDAFLQLANLLYSKDRKDDLNALEAKYREPMFGGKSSAVFKGDADKAYRFHIALGTLYTYTEKYGDASTPASSIYQLNAAKKDAAALKRSIDPQAVEFLARGYEKTGKTAQAIDVRLGATEEYKSKGQFSAAARTIEPVAAQVNSLSPEVRTRYETLYHDLPTTNPGGKGISPKDGNSFLPWTHDLEIEVKPPEWKKWYEIPVKPKVVVPEDDIRKLLEQYYASPSVDKQSTLRKQLEKYKITKIETDFKTMADVTLLDDLGTAFTMPVRLKAETIGMAETIGTSYLPMNTPPPAERIESLVRKMFATDDLKARDAIMKELKKLGVQGVQQKGRALAVVTVKGDDSQLTTMTVTLTDK
jgi:tetratricopeptide (TPR) repeat protein